MLLQEVRALSHNRCSSYLIGYFIVIFCYDFFLTLESEIDLFWCREWSFVSILFILNRYTPIIGIGLELMIAFAHVSPNVSQLLE